MKIVTVSKKFDFSLYVLDLRRVAEGKTEFTFLYLAVRIDNLFIYLPHIAYLSGLKRVAHAYLDVCKYVRMNATGEKDPSLKFTLINYTVVDCFVSILGLCIRPICISVQCLKPVAKV